MLDNSAPGRLWIVVGAGYREEEFEMAGLEHAAVAVLEEYVGVLLQAWKGEPFDWRGRTVTVTPKPATGRIRCCSSAGESPPRPGEQRGCGCRCCR